jgi:hypothetical protein
METIYIIIIAIFLIIMISGLCYWGYGYYGYGYNCDSIIMDGTNNINNNVIIMRDTTPLSYELGTLIILESLIKNSCSNDAASSYNSYKLSDDPTWSSSLQNLWHGLSDPANMIDNQTLMFTYLTERVAYLKSQVDLNKGIVAGNGFYNGTNMVLISTATAPAIEYLTNATNAFNAAQIAITAMDMDTTLKNLFSGLFYKYCGAMATVTTLFPVSKSETAALQLMFTAWINNIVLSSTITPLTLIPFKIPQITFFTRTAVISNIQGAFLEKITIDSSSFSSFENMSRVLIENINQGVSYNYDFYSFLFNGNILTW